MTRAESAAEQLAGSLTGMSTKDVEKLIGFLEMGDYISEDRSESYAAQTLKHMGIDLIPVYRDILKKRYAALREANQIIADATSDAARWILSLGREPRQFLSDILQAADDPKLCSQLEALYFSIGDYLATIRTQQLLATAEELNPDKAKEIGELRAKRAGGQNLAVQRFLEHRK